MIWVRRWLALAAFVVIGLTGTVYSLLQPRVYTADALLMLDVRPDPILGNLGAAAGMATQIEVIKTEKVAARAVEIMEFAKDPGRVTQWQAATAGAVPLERYFASMLQRDLRAEALRGSNLIEISFSSANPAFAIAAVNAFGKAVSDVAVGMRVEPARESADWFGLQAGSLRADLEAAQTKLSKFQQDKGIVVGDDKVSEELSRLNGLEAQLLVAQGARLEASGRVRDAGSQMSSEVQQSATVQILKSQLSAAEVKRTEISGVLGTSHPQFLQIEAQIASLRQQLALEINRVAGGASVASRISSQKVDELRAMVDAQKRHVLSLRTQRDQIAVLQRDIDTAQQAYERASQRAGQLSLESQVSQTGIRLLNPAVEASDPSQKKLILRILASLLGGLAVGAALAIGLEMLDRRVRGLEDLQVGIPVLGVLQPVGSKRSMFRPLLAQPPTSRNPMLPMPEAR
jgi:chain length determinant protein EpsF